MRKTSIRTNSSATAPRTSKSRFNSTGYLSLQEAGYHVVGRSSGSMNAVEVSLRKRKIPKWGRAGVWLWNFGHFTYLGLLEISIRPTRPPPPYTELEMGFTGHRG